MRVACTRCLSHCVWLTKVVSWSLSPTFHRSGAQRPALGAFQFDQALRESKSLAGTSPTSTRPSCMEQLDLPMYHLAAGVLLCLAQVPRGLRGLLAPGSC